MCTPPQDMHVHSHTWHACALTHMTCIWVPIWLYQWYMYIPHLTFMCILPYMTCMCIPPTIPWCMCTHIHTGRMCILTHTWRACAPLSPSHMKSTIEKVNFCWDFELNSVGKVRNFPGEWKWQKNQKLTHNDNWNKGYFQIMWHSHSLASWDLYVKRLY